MVNNTQHKTKEIDSTSSFFRAILDPAISLILFVIGFYSYVSTLAPTVLEGDAALFQYTPYVLGVTYPTGYPLYILLGKLWVWLLPVGEIAWRMNLLSALCAALTLPLLYGAIRRLYAPRSPEFPPVRVAAIAAVLIFATLPTFWRWSTEAKIYALNILLFSGVLYTLSRALSLSREPGCILSPKTLHLLPAKHRLSIAAWYNRWPLILPVLLCGLQIAVHSTTVLLLPGLLLFVWLHLRPYLFTWRRFLIHTLLLILPGFLYLYVPVRAEWLIARYGRSEAIQQGLLADFYYSGFSGWIRYFSAADFTGGVVTNWGLIPQLFSSVYLPLLFDEFTTLGVFLGVAGGLAFAISQPRLFSPLFLLYIIPIPFVLTYGQGEQAAFLLPSFLMFAIFAGYSLVAVTQLFTLALKNKSRVATAVSYLVPLVLLVSLLSVLLIPQIQENTLWLRQKWNRDIYNQWDDTLNHPIDTSAGLLAHWGDLTSFWYLQHAEGRRPDVRGLYPPDENTVVDWFDQGKRDLFIAGPLQGWADGLETRYQFVPWGRLVRIASLETDPQSLLPALEHQVNIPFGTHLQLLAADFNPQAAAGKEFPVMLAWQALSVLPPETTLSLRLILNDAVIIQLDEPVRSAWFPRETLPEGQYVLSYPLLPIPLGTLPGSYRLQLVAYADYKAPWPMPDGSVVLDLGSVEILPPSPGTRPDPDEYKVPPQHDFGAEIQLAGYDYSVNRVGQGKGFSLRLLWQALTTPAENYTLLVEQLDTDGNVLRSTATEPVGGKSATSSWQSGQFIRDQVDLVVPASAPAGDQSLRVRLSWLRPDGGRVDFRRWYIPLGEGLILPPLIVTEKQDRVFILPDELTYRLDVNFDDKARLVGYNQLLPSQIETSSCADQRLDECRVRLDFFWQGLAEMEQPYTIFFHVVDKNGQIVVQTDHAPGARGKQPTTGWLPGEVVLDPIDLPLPVDVKPGTYTLRVGMYLPPTGPPLPVQNDSGQPAGGFVDVGEVTVN